MNGSGMPFSASDSPRRGSAHHPPASMAENNSHRPTRVHFPDNGTGSEAFPRIRGADSEFDLHPFHGDGRRTGLVDTIVGFFAFYLTIVCLCGLMAIMVILYLTVRPFSVNVYRRLSAHIGMSTFLDAMSLLLPDTRLIVTGDSDIPTPIGASLFVCNHLLDGDYWVKRKNRFLVFCSRMIFSISYCLFRSTTCFLMELGSNNAWTMHRIYGHYESILEK